MSVKNSVNIFLATTLAIFLQTEDLRAEELLSVQNALAMAFPDSDSVKQRVIVASISQKEKLKGLIGKKKKSTLFRYYEGLRENGCDGYAIIDKVKGKHGSITFMVILDPELTVRRVDILQFREQRGRPVSRRRFLSQFRGKNSSDPIRLHVDIHGVTGATISSRAVISGVRSVLSHAAVLIPRDELNLPDRILQDNS